MPVITSRQHPEVKRFRAAARGETTAALVDGWHLLAEAARAALEVETVAVAGEPPNAAAATLVRTLARTSRVVTVSPDVMHAMSPVRSPSGVAALVRRRAAALADVLTPVPPLVIVTVDLQDPGNAGALVRAAEAGGATGVVFSGTSADPWNWKALRAAMGSTFRLPVVREASGDAVCGTLRAAGLRIMATTPRGGVGMEEADLRAGLALLIGGEGDGLSPPLLQSADTVVSIPMHGAVESLNVAVAAAVLVYEARRQRQTGPPPAAAARQRR